MAVYDNSKHHCPFCGNEVETFYDSKGRIAMFKCQNPKHTMTVIRSK